MRNRWWLSLSISGCLYLSSLVLFANFSVMGEGSKVIQNYILDHYKLFLALYNLKILLAYAAVGLILALFTLLLRQDKPWQIVLFNLAFWLGFWLRGIKLYPQMFCEQLYSNGGIGKYFQIFITDYVPLPLILGLPIAYVLFLGIRFKRPLQSGLVLFLLLLFFFPYQRGYLSSKHVQTSDAPNMIILASDSLRPDHISYNGYSRPTPNIDQLFSSGANFLNMYSSLAKTFPSWTSVLTSLYPPDHDVRHMFPTFDDRRKKWLTMVDRLNEKNYHSVVISDFAGDMFSRIDYGFQEVDAPHFSMKVLIRQRSLEIHHLLVSLLLSPHGNRLFPVLDEMAFYTDPYSLTEKTKKHIHRALQKKQPFCVLTFYSTSHFPYCPKYPYYQTYCDKGYRGPNKYKKENLLDGYTQGELPALEKEHLIGLYDGGIKIFDQQVGELLRYLKQAGVSDNTCVVVMSDHGENLYDINYGMGHGDHLMGDIANRMVFGIYSPNRHFKGVRIRNSVRDIDVAPTLLDLLGISSPKSFKGQSLIPLAQGEYLEEKPVYMETGLWFDPKIPFLSKGIRINYPGITQVLTPDKSTHELVLQPEWQYEIINAKHRAISYNGLKYLYMPGENFVIQRLYPLDKSQITGNEIHNQRLKGKYSALMKNLFPGKFIQTPRGYLFEKGAFPDNLLYGGREPVFKNRWQDRDQVYFQRWWAGVVFSCCAAF